MPLLPLVVGQSADSKFGNVQDMAENLVEVADSSHITQSQHIRIRNRRKRYLDANPEYFGPSLELAGLRHDPPRILKSTSLIIVSRSATL